MRKAGAHGRAGLAGTGVVKVDIPEELRFPSLMEQVSGGCAALGQLHYKGSW